MKPRDRDRWDRHGRIRWLAESGSWCMVRRRGAVPFVMAKAEFLALSPTPLDETGRHGPASAT